MTGKCNEILDEMENSGSSESLAVADCLRTIASNGGEQGYDKYLIGCAEEIRDAAQGFIAEMKRKRKPAKKDPRVFFVTPSGVTGQKGKTT